MPSDDSQLMMRGTRSRVNGSRKTIITNGWPPVTLSLGKHLLAIPREIAKVDEGLVARKQHSMAKLAREL